MIHPPVTGAMPDTSNPDRLAELEAYDILDTAPDEGFDDVVELARLVCDAPVALVSFVARDRQWFKARAGFAPCETDLRSSVCAYALTEPDLLVIPDLGVDPRTRANPLVSGEPRIRFYAGAPLRTPSGHVIGSLCVIDTAARPTGLTENQAHALRRLARQIMILLRERRQVVRLQAGEQDARTASERRTALIELGDRLRDASTVEEMVSKAADIVGRILGGSRADYGELDATGEIVTILQDRAGPGEISVVRPHRLVDYGEIGPVINRGDPVVVVDMADDPRTAARAEAFAAIDIKAMCIVPVQERGRTVGLIFVHSATSRRWTPEEIAFARNVADRVQAGTARLRAEARQALLNRELSHRMKNTLAMVQAIATQTLRNAADLDAAREALTARLVALGKAHDLLLNGTGESASLDALIRGELAMHDDAQADRFLVSGPFVHIRSGAAMSLSLMIHELATNAAKYGALSTPEGRIQVAWTIERGAEAVIRLRWRETGGPPVVPPSRRGFGSRLIERGLAGALGGEVRLTYAPAGVECELSATLANLGID